MKKRGAKPGHPNYRTTVYPERVAVKMTTEMKQAIQARTGDLSGFVRDACQEKLDSIADLP